MLFCGLMNCFGVCVVGFLWGIWNSVMDVFLWCGWIFGRLLVVVL